jgi:hypothetical protein
MPMAWVPLDLQLSGNVHLWWKILRYLPMFVAVQLWISQVHVGQNIKFCLRNVEPLRNAQFVYQ